MRRLFEGPSTLMLYRPARLLNPLRVTWPHLLFLTANNIRGTPWIDPISIIIFQARAHFPLPIVKMVSEER